MSPSEPTFSSLAVRSSCDAAVLLDHAGCILRWAAGAEAIYGYSAAVAAGRTCGWLMPELTEEAVAEWLAEARAEGTSTRTLRQQRRNGSAFLANVELLALRPGREGAAAFTLWVTPAPRASDPRWATVAEKARCILWEADVRRDAAGEWSWELRLADEGAAQRLLPLDLQPNEEYASAWYRSRLDEDRERHEAFAREQLLAGNDYAQELRCRDRDGRLLWLREDVTVERVGSDRWKLVGVSVDVTEAREAEAARQQQERQFRFQARLLDAIGQSVIATDLDGTIFYWNRAAHELYGWTAEEAIGANVSMLLPERDDYPQHAQTIRSGTATQDDLWLRHRDGRVFPVQVTGVGLYNADGQLTGRIGVSIDITERKQAEIALRASEARLRQVLASARCILWQAEIHWLGDRFQWTTTMWDDAAAQEFLPLEIPPGGSYPQAFYSARPVEDQDRMRATSRSALLSGASGYTQEFRCRNRDGRVRWLWEDVRLEPAGTDSWRAVGVCTDITERKAAEEKRRRSEGLFRAVIENAALGVAVVTPDDRLVLANPAFCAMLGYSETELRGLTSAQITHPDDLKRELSLLQELVGRKQGLYRLEKRFLNRHGEEIWAHLTASVVTDEAGTIIFGIGLVEDIRERKRAEERTGMFLSLGKQLNRTSTPEEAAQIVLDAADRLLGWDACWLELIRDEDGTAMPVLLIDEIDGRRTRVEDASPGTPFAQRAMEEGPFRVLREPGAEVVLSEPFGDCERPSASILCVPIRVRDRAIGALSIQTYRYFAYQEQDLQTLQALADYCAGALERTRADEARQELESQLVQAVKMEAVGRLAGGIAHDSNNMLAVINGYSELLLGMVSAGSPLVPGLQEIRRAGDRVAAMTRQLLAFSRKQMAQPKVVCLNEVVRGAERMLHPLLGEDIALLVDLSPHAGRIRIDPNHLEQVLVNLAVNARDAMPRGGRLSFTTGEVTVDSVRALALGDVPPGEYAELIVADDGCGIEPELLPRIFEPFFTTKEVGHGTGLGLAMVYGIVRQNEGKIVVESRPNEGTTFRIYFPQVDREPTQHGVSAPAAPGPGTETVLVVEDNDVLRALVQSVLRSSGYQILTARNAVEALEMGREHSERIDLLVTDVVLPGRNGRELAEEFFASHPEAKVLFMSGYTGDTVIIRGIAHGERNFLQKPFLPATLVARVREILTDAT